MGTIAVVTPKDNICPTVNRRNVRDIDNKNLAKVDIVEYRHAKNILKEILFCELPILPNAP